MSTLTKHLQGHWANIRLILTIRSVLRGVVSEILNGKRELNRQVRLLVKAVSSVTRRVHLSCTPLAPSNTASWHTVDKSPQRRENHRVARMFYESI